MTGSIHIGIAGWSYPDWQGIVYTRKLDPLAYVSTFVDCIEINYYYKREELTQIKERVIRLADTLDEMVVIGNNHYRGAELANAIELKSIITGKKQPVPTGLLKTYPDLERIALPEPNEDRLLF